jgi:hypothetical protein
MTDRRAVMRLVVMLACGAAIASSVAIMLSNQRQVTVPPAGGDSRFFEEVVARVRSGEGYYVATGALLRANHYPLTSVFNWRLPLLYVAIARVSEPGASFVLWALALLLLVRATPILRGVLGVLPLLPGLFIVTVRPALFLTELWAGVCIGHSVVSYARNRRLEGVAWAVVALFIRELAAVYCVVAGVHAVWRRQWREVLAWTVGAAAFAIYFGVHTAMVRSNVHAGDPAQPRSWIAFGGLPFMLRAFREGAGLLGLLPPLLFGIIIALAVSAWWSKTMPWHVRAGVPAYAALFLIVGQPFNVYWGDIIGPLFGLWLAYVDPIRDLLRRSAAPTTKDESTVSTAAQ